VYSKNQFGSCEYDAWRTNKLKDWSYNESVGGGLSMKSPSKNIFWGRCDRCGEAYEAETTLEDLEGVRFQCKKMICDGQVQLKFTAMKDLPPPSQDKNPRRYC